MRSLKLRLFAAAAVVVFAVAGFNISKLFQQDPPDLKLVLNIPASRLDVYENGERTHSYDVSPGAQKFATPAGHYRIQQITWNPWWHPPKSEWARNEKPAPPGPNNPMGPVKINFADMLYIHGTVWEDRLGSPDSHGCVRIGRDDLFELARIIQKHRTPNVDEATLASLQANPEVTRTFYFKAVPFDVVYNLVEVRDGKLVIYPDVYGKASDDLTDQIVAALKGAGIDMSDAIESRLASISKRRVATHISVALDSLTSAAGAGD